MKKITIQDKFTINIPLSNTVDKNGNLYDRRAFKHAIDEYENNILEEKIEKRNEIIDIILKEEE